MPYMKNFWTMLPLFILLSGSVALAQDFKRFEFHVSAGLTVSGGIPLEPENDVTYTSIHVNNSHNIGAAFAINLNQLDAIELYWQRQFTEGRLPAEIAAPL